NTNGCSTIVPVAVIINPLPVITITNPAAVCSPNTVDITATAVTTGSDTGLTYTYFTDALAATPLATPSAVTTSGTYYIKGTNANGCSTIVPVTILVNALPIITITNPAAVCSPNTVDITATAVTTGSDIGLTYTYFTDALAATPLATPSAVTTSGTYYIKGTNTNGCSTIVPVAVIINISIILVGTESTICAADGLGYVLTLKVSGQAPFVVTGTGVPGIWSGTTWTSNSIPAGTNYNVSVQDVYACNTLVVANIAPTCCVFQVVCPTFPATTIASYNQLPTATSLTIAEFEALGNGDGIIGNNPCGVIEITASNGVNTGCSNCSVIRTYTVTEYADTNNNKMRDVGENTVLNSAICTQTISISKVVSNDASLSNLIVSDGILSPAFNTDTMNYTDGVVNNIGSITVTPTVTDPTATITINGITVINNGSIAIVLNVGDNMIRIVVTAQDGTTKETYTIDVNRSVAPNGVVVNNVLTPNGDGKNDYWEIKDILLYPNNKVTVYDRAGRIVYSKNTYANDWDGSYQGAPLSNETYYYLIDLGSDLAKIKGFITIIRN
ncbi:gliding motility-associated C-terminal domain-containing protein, partial [Flavobacterium sp. LS1R49]